MGESDARKWDAIHSSGGHAGSEPAAVLADHVHLLPQRGRALDLACGRGANARLLARRGLETFAWDISSVAVAALAEEAQRAGLQIAAEQRDVAASPPGPRSFDVIVVSHFLDRTIIPAITAALRPAGLVFYQTFIAEAAAGHGPRNPDYRLGRNELLRLFASLPILVYREEGRVGDVSRGFRNEAMLVAQAPAED